jgi:hypothetical protein
MAHYYYLLSSLPMLTFGETPPLTDDDFMATCRSMLEATLVEALEAVTPEPEHIPGSPAEQAWQVWETHIRNTLAKQRAAALGKDPAAWLRAEADVFPGDRRRAEAAADNADPLTREKELDRLRWSRLDELAVGHDFDFDALVIYRLRLLILEKWRRRSPETGLEQRDALIEEGVKQADRQCVAVDGRAEA